MSVALLYSDPVEWSLSMEIEKAVGEELRACRQRKRISQEQLGFDAAIHRTYVSLIERGVKSPTLGMLFRLCSAFDVPRAYPKWYVPVRATLLSSRDGLEHNWFNASEADRS